MNSHLFHKHNNYGCDRYASEFGEFRQKFLKLQQRLSASNVNCKECNEKVMNHKHLMHHLITNHKMKWQEYYIKHYFNNIWPLCACGCGNKVKLIKSGKNEKGEESYARTMLPGHQPWKKTGYRLNSRQSKDKMRIAAINRIKRTGKYFNNGQSNLEKNIVQFLKENGIKNVILNDRTVLSGQEIDILIPDKNVGFEINGARFHSDLFKSKNFHQNKVDECNEKGIRLIHIWEHDLINRRDQIYRWILNQLNINQRRIFARQCIVKEISYQHSNEFCQQYHLQGPCVSKYRYGLFYNNELMAVMTFSSPRRVLKQKNGHNTYELARFCTKDNVQIIGGGSKLLQAFVKQQNPSIIVSFCNYNWSNGNFYKKLGMKFISKTAPGYFYVKGKQKISRVNAMKHKLISMGADPKKTEYEIMTEYGFYRIYDAGNLKFELHCK